ncbi:methylmalonyl-CoA mutase family protein [Pyxidicoccus sp. 3LFB2]
MSQGPLPTDTEFPPPSLDAWRRLVEKDLKGKPFTSLQSSLEGGLSLKPLYTSQDVTSPAEPPGVAPYVRGAQPLGHTEGGWTLCQEYAGPDLASTAEALRNDLERGAQGVWLLLDAPHGVDVKDAASLERLLAGARWSARPCTWSPRATCSPPPPCCSRSRTRGAFRARP